MNLHAIPIEKIPRKIPHTNPTPPDRSGTTRQIRHHQTNPTDCIHLIIPRSWVRSPPALLRGLTKISPDNLRKIEQFGSPFSEQSPPRGSGGTSKTDQLRTSRCQGWQIAGAKPLEPHQLIAGDEIRCTRRGKRDEHHVEMEYRLNDGPTPVGRETDVNGRRVNVRYQARLLEELSSSGGAEAGVIGFQVPTEWPPPRVAAVTGE